MSTLQVDFPDPWALLPVRQSGMASVDDLVDGLAELGEEAQRAAAEYLTAVLPDLANLGVDGFASLALADQESGQLVQAFCAIGIVPAAGGGDAELRAIAEGGLHPGLERDTTTVDLPAGAAVRSSAVRFAEELMDTEGVAPYAGEVRFAFPMDGDRIGVLHFETLSLVYLEELEELFDAIAGTARVA